MYKEQWANGFYYKFIEPEKAIANFVENIGMFHNLSDTAKEVVVVPDGRIDFFRNLHQNLFISR